VVYNFAGIADIGQANLSIVRTTELNVLGNSLVLDACVRHKVKRFVFASTLYVYSKDGGFYRCSKQACELFIENCHATYGLDYTILRYGSLYGPRSDHRNAIYRFVREALERKRISYFGHPTALREYVHVEDAATATLEILESEFANQNVIITGNQPMQVGDLLRMLSEMLGGGIEFEFLDKEATGHYEITPYSFSPKIGHKLIPRLNIDLGQGLLRVIEDVHRELNPELSSVQDLLFKKE
ncbi:MAG: NAD-dependent epimerase/dehydratase family protein, partial [Desulfovibrionaceae bacterium]|nr:NAD-dependent epimerase/dehydratase family protein [Desulfovibrionaceae bacterium]